MGLIVPGYRKQGQTIGKSAHKRAKHIYERRAAYEIVKALKRRDGSQGAASKPRKVQVTPKLRAKYEAICNGRAPERQEAGGPC